MIGRDCSNKRESTCLFCLELEPNIFDIPENKCVTEIGAPLYKVSCSKLFWFLNQNRWGTNCKIHIFIAVLERRRWLTASRNGDLVVLRMKRSLFVFYRSFQGRYVINQWEWPTFGEVLTKFKARHKFNRNIRNNKDEQG